MDLPRRTSASQIASDLLPGASVLGAKNDLALAKMVSGAGPLFAASTRFCLAPSLRGAIETKSGAFWAVLRDGVDLTCRDMEKRAQLLAVRRQAPPRERRSWRLVQDAADHRTGVACASTHAGVSSWHECRVPASRQRPHGRARARWPTGDKQRCLAWYKVQTGPRARAAIAHLHASVHLLPFGFIERRVEVNTRTPNLECLRADHAHCPCRVGYVLCISVVWPLCATMLYPSAVPDVVPCDNGARTLLAKLRVQRRRQR